MSLHPQWAQAVFTYFATRAELVACPICPASMMRIGTAVEMPGLAGNPAEYVIGLTCPKCAHVRLFSINAIVDVLTKSPP